MTHENKPYEVRKALQVIVQTPHIVDYLLQNDPKALEQARRALGICIHCGQGPLGEAGYEHKSYCRLWVNDEDPADLVLD
jgi:hypothetical protein